MERARRRHPDIAGNPTYDRTHLDLQRRFGIETPVRADSADDIWRETKPKLTEPELRPQTVVRDMNVEAFAVRPYVAT